MRRFFLPALLVSALATAALLSFRRAHRPAAVPSPAAESAPLPSPAPGMPRLSPAVASRPVPREPGQQPVRLRTGDAYVLPLSELPAGRLHAAPSPRGYPWVVQARGPVTPAFREALAAAGLVLHGYLPDNALLAEGPLPALRALASRPDIAGAFEFAPAQKLSPSLAARLRPLRAEETLPVRFQTFSPADAADLAALATSLGAENITFAAARRRGLVRGDMPAAAVAALAGDARVRYLEPYATAHVLNEHAGEPQALSFDSLLDAGTLTGEGQIVGHADTGLDKGDLTDLHADFAGRILQAVLVTPTITSWKDLSGHGTHTAGSIVGTGAASANLCRGVAPGARLFHQAIGYGRSSSLYTPDDIADLFAPAYEAGARIHSDSWGTGETAYDSDAQAVDEYAFDHPDFLIVFAAGNEGEDADADGVIDRASCLSPATAKNLLAVGAAENARDRSEGTPCNKTYKSLYGCKAEPIASDYPSEPFDGDPSHTGMAPFSSRGPARDGRIKPDIVAPGVNAVSVRTRATTSPLHGTVVPANTNYAFMSGTSQATPRIAGVAALFREHCAKNLGLADPSAALLRAAIAGGAETLHPGQYGTDGFLEIPAVRPNNVEGHGMAKVLETAFPASPLAAAWNDGGFLAEAGDETEIRFYLTTNGLPLVAALAWTDAPAELASLKQLVQDLDLALVAPDGTVHRPNGLAGPDRLDPLEAVRLDAAAGEGLWRAVVSAHDLPEGPTAFATYVRGAVAAVPALSHEPPGFRLAEEGATEGPALFLAADTWGMPCETNGASLLWREAGGSGWNTNALDAADGGWTGTLPAAPAGTRWEYLFSFACPALEEPEILSADGEGTPFALLVCAPAALAVSGVLAEDGSDCPAGDPEPPYGGSTFPAGYPFAVSAPLLAPDPADDRSRFALDGFSLTNAEAAGDREENGRRTLSLVSPGDAALVWQWKRQVSLAVSTEPATTVATNWFDAGSTARGTAVPPRLLVEGEPWGFYGWSHDGEESVASPASPTLDGLAVDGPAAWCAHYLPLSQDDDANGLPDAFELRYFGAIGQDPDGDGDGDGVSNADEAAGGSDPTDPASVPAPPTILLGDFPETLAVPAPWPFSCTVTAPDGVASAVLRHTREGYVPARVALSPADASSPTGGVFSGAFLPTNRTGTVVEYAVIAKSAGGLSATSETRTVTVAYPRLAGDGLRDLAFALPAERTTNAVFALTNAGHGTLHLSLAALPYGFSDDVEEPLRMTHAGTNDVWHPCETVFQTGSNAWHFALSATEETPFGADAWLETPDVVLLPADIAGAPRLAFRHWHDGEDEVRDDGTMGMYDAGFLELSADGGETWETLVPDGGYGAVFNGHAHSPQPDGTPCFADTTNAAGTIGWADCTADLAAWAGKTVRIRFRYGSDLYSTSYGWFVDAVRISPMGGTGSALSEGWVAADLPDALAAGGAGEFRLSFDTAFLEPAEGRVAALFLAHDDPEQASPLALFCALSNTSRRIEAAADGPGAVAPAEAVVTAPGETVEVAYAAEEGAFLAALASNGVAMPLPEVVTNWTVALDPAAMPENAAFAGTFKMLLPAEDVPDAAWLARYGLDGENAQSAGQSDGDGDGFLAWQEWHGGTDPTDGGSIPFRLELLDGAGAYRFWTRTNAADAYGLEHAPALTGNWTTQLTHPYAFPAVTSSLPADPTGFWRLSIP